ALTQVEQDAVSGKQRQQTFTYCEQVDVTAGSCPLVGVLLRVDGARTDLSDATTYDYYPAAQGGDLKTITNAVGQVTQFLSYDSAGRLLSQKDPNGVVTDYSYDARGRLTASMVRGQDSGSETDDRITRYSYLPTGLVKQVALPGGDVSDFTYDSAFRLTKVSDRYGNAILYTLDKSGHLIKEDITDAKGVLKSTMSRLYDELGHLKTTADAQGNPTDFTYDAVGTLKERTDAMGRSSTYTYDALHRLKQSIEDAGGIKVTSAFQYDVLGQPSVVTDPKGLKTTYQRNGLGELLALQSPDTGSTGFTYDDAGNVLSRKDAASRQATYTYDALNRPVSVTYADAALETRFVYDVAPAVCVAGEQFAAGRLASMKDGSGTTQYCYNRFGDLVRKVQTTNGKALTVRYAYTAGGNLTSMVYPDEAMVDYVRNELG
ncbi:RHS repeat protein, partial [Xanthomonas hortorum pv. pelargonii]|nr:RHS repeat protein [Xanthomonas hortorum pv. pelargonii]MCM5538685.1 RHS repeat protein [Xanthomonas hortorum pv. pelargonii]MCM5542908.1 RHS repeat protein [Xanthomonas hortorum pv. pelargonii]MCM5564596.1 RHS repeat protein [Xanthomonas hortorum pv. pelargonii]MCM5568834.1 RHS repeat protein [Xanthomonas hortorum pv. pelargonii]